VPLEPVVPPSPVEVLPAKAELPAVGTGDAADPAAAASPPTSTGVSSTCADEQPRAKTVSSGESAARRNVLMVLTVIHSDYGSGNTDYCPKEGTAISSRRPKTFVSKRRASGEIVISAMIRWANHPSTRAIAS
jgi:hypothetical protein